MSQVPQGKTERFPGPGFICMSPASNSRRITRERFSLFRARKWVCLPCWMFTVSAKENPLMWVAQKETAVETIGLEIGLLLVLMKYTIETIVTANPRNNGYFCLGMEAAILDGSSGAKE